MVADEQTHTLPDEVEAVERFARFLGYGSRAAFARDLLGHLNVVQGHYSKLFEGDPAGTAKLPAVDYSAGAEDARLLEHLATLGFKKPVMVAQTVQQWMAGEYRAFRRKSTRNAFVEFVPALIAGLANAEAARRRGDGLRPLPAGAAARRAADHRCSARTATSWHWWR